MSHRAPQQDLIDMFQQMLGGSLNPMQQMLVSSFDPEALGKRINELKTVEAWLRANLTTLEFTIKALEAQKSVLEHGARAQQEAGDANANPLANPALWAWNLMQESVKGFGEGVQRATEHAAAEKAGAKKPATRKKREE